MKKVEKSDIYGAQRCTRMREDERIREAWRYINCNEMDNARGIYPELRARGERARTEGSKAL